MPESPRRTARLAEGLCAMCGVHPREPDRTKCEQCLEAGRVWAAARRAHARRLGLCEACMKTKAIRGRGRRCDACADKYIEAQLARDRATRASATGRAVLDVSRRKSAAKSLKRRRGA